MADRPYRGEVRRLTFTVMSLAAVMAFPQAASAGDPGPSSAESEFAGLLNEVRAHRGLPALAISPALTEVAGDYVAENVAHGGISHDRDAPYTARANKAGCTGWSGPTLARGYGTPAEVLQGWLGSPPHRAILLDPTNTHVGPGFQGDYAVVYALDCTPPTPAPVPPAPFGLSDISEGGIDTALSVSSKRPRTRGRTISTQVRIRAGKGTLGLAARSGRRAARGRRVSVVKRARSYRVAVRVSRPGRWKVSLRVNGRVARRFTVRVRAGR